MREEKIQNKSYRSWELPQTNEKTKPSRVKKGYVPEVEYIQIKPQIAKKKNAKQTKKPNKKKEILIFKKKFFFKWQTISLIVDFITNNGNYNSMLFKTCKRLLPT